VVSKVRPLIRNTFSGVSGDNVWQIWIKFWHFLWKYYNSSSLTTRTLHSNLLQRKVDVSKRQGGGGRPTFICPHGYGPEITYVIYYYTTNSRSTRIHCQKTSPTNFDRYVSFIIINYSSSGRYRHQNDRGTVGDRRADGSPGHAACISNCQVEKRGNCSCSIYGQIAETEPNKRLFVNKRTGYLSLRTLWRGERSAFRRIRH